MQPTRTVLVYMVATNSLGSSNFDFDDIDEIKKAALAGDFGDSHLLIYHAPYIGEVQLKEVLSDGTINVLKTYTNSNGESVTIERMKEVISDTKLAAPARDYGLVLWSHANGWIVDGIHDTPAKSGMHYSFGMDRSKKMDISSLRTAVDGAGFSFIYFDCCYMGGIEVVYELRGVTNQAVVSAAEVAAPGMPYDLSLRYLMSQKVDLVKAAETTYAYYNTQTSLFDRSCTIAVVDFAGLDNLAQATRKIYQSAAQPVPDGYTGHAFSANMKNYFDFAHYIDALTSDDLPAREAWHKAFDQVVIYKNQTPYFQTSVDLSVHCGLSTYIFSNEEQTLTNGYNTTQWYIDVASALIK